MIKIDKLLQLYKEDILKHHAEPRNLDELAQIVIATINRNVVSDVEGCRVVGFVWDIKHGAVRTSHSHPILTERNESVPYYGEVPGWNGRVWIRFSDEIKHWGSDSFSRTLTYPGTGGAGSYNGPWAQVAQAHFNRFGHGTYPKIHCFSWEYRLYDSDWPLLAEVIEWEKNKTWAVLTDTTFNRPDHQFKWVDESVAAADEKFIQECNRELELA
jgi:hypothetical protein